MVFIREPEFYPPGLRVSPCRAPTNENAWSKTEKVSYQAVCWNDSSIAVYRDWRTVCQQKKCSLDVRIRLASSLLPVIVDESTLYNNTCERSMRT